MEIGEKASGFVPLAECSFAKLKTVREGVCRCFMMEKDNFFLQCSPWRCFVWG